MLYEILALVAGMALILVVLGFFGLSEIISTLLSADLRLIVLAVLIEIAFIFLLAMRLKIIARREPLSVKDAFQINTTGIFVGLLSPLARIGGEPVKIYLLKDKLGSTRASAVVAIDTLVEVFSLYIVVLAAATLLSGSIPSAVFSPLFVFLFLAVYSSIVFLKVCSSEKWLGDILNWFSRFRRFSKLREKDYAALFHNSFRLLAKDKRMLLASFSISILTKLLEFMRLLVILLALRQSIAFELIILFWAFLLVLSAVPFLPGGLGLIEGGGTLGLVFLGIEKSAAAAALLIDRFVSYWLVLLLGFAVIWRSRFTYRFLRKLRR